MASGLSDFFRNIHNTTKSGILQLKTSLPSPVDICVPESWIGSDLSPIDYSAFVTIKDLIDRLLYYRENVPLNHFEIGEKLFDIKSPRNSWEITAEVFKYLRIKLLSKDSFVVEDVVSLLDFLVKNGGYQIHVCVNNKKFIKTLSLVARRQLVTPGMGHQRIGEHILDCIQAWGEAFVGKQEMYPNIWNTYVNLKIKYRTQFPRSDFDQSRVPIFLPSTNPSVESSTSSLAMVPYHSTSDLLDIGTLLEDSNTEPLKNEGNLSRSSSRCIEGYDIFGGYYVSCPSENSVDPFEHPFCTNSYEEISNKEEKEYCPGNKEFFK